MSFILDASVTLAWAFMDETSTYAEAVFDQVGSDSALVPSVWWLEVMNTLLVGERRQRLTSAQSAHFVEVLESLPIAIDPDSGAVAPGRLLSVSRDLGLTVYDASYVDLALRQDLPLATLDARMQAAAQGAGARLIVT